MNGGGFISISRQLFIDAYYHENPMERIKARVMIYLLNTACWKQTDFGSYTLERGELLFSVRNTFPTSRCAMPCSASAGG